MFDVQQGQSRDSVIDSEDTLRLCTKLCVPDEDELRNEIMEETHFYAYNIRPGSINMYHDLKDTYWWNRMKKDIVDFMSRVGADNFRESSQHSANIEDSFQQVEELCRP